MCSVNEEAEFESKLNETMDMDIDENEENNDHLEEFLLHKLKEIQNATRSLQSDYNKKQDVIKKCAELIKNSECQNRLKVVNSWKRIYCGIVVFAFDLSNLDKSCISDVNVILNWSSKQPLNYATKILSKQKERPPVDEYVHPNKVVQEFLEIVKASPNVHKSQPAVHEWIEVDRITQSATLLVKITVPKFSTEKCLDFEAIVTYVTLGEKGQSLVKPFSFSANDLRNADFGVRSTEILLGKDEAFLTAVFALERTVLDVTFLDDENEKNFDSSLQIYCMLDSVSVTSSSKWYYANNLGEVLSGVLIQLQPYEGGAVQRINVYARDDNQLYAMLHHLHAHVHGIEVRIHRPEDAPFNRKMTESSIAVPAEMPLFPSQAFFTAPPSSEPTQRDANLLGECLEEQIVLVETFCTQSGKQRDNGDLIDFTANAQEYVQFRTELADLEKNTDVLLAAIARRSAGDE